MKKGFFYMRIAAFFLSTIATLGIASAEEMTTVTKESETKFDLPKEVVAFVNQLIEKHPETKAKYGAIIAPLVESVGGPHRFTAEPFIATEWRAEAGRRRDLTEANYKGVYLVVSKLSCFASRGYLVPDPVVAKVTVTEHTRGKVGENDGFIFLSSKLTLHFEGFVEVSLIPK